MEILLFYLIALRPIFSMLDGYLKGIGPISMGLTLIVILMFLIEYKISIFKWLLIIFFTGNLIISLIISSDIITSLVDSAKLLITILIFLIVADTKFINKFKVFFEMRKGLILFQSVLVQLILIINFFDDSKYYYSFDEKFFVGPFSHPHTLAYVLLSLIFIGVALTKLSEKYIYLIAIVIPMCLLLYTGARTVFIVCIMFLIIIFNTNRRFSIVFFLLAGFIGIINLRNIPIFSKSVSSNELNDIFSGRIDFWTIDLVYFFESNLFTKLYGSGLDFPYYLHFVKFYGNAIWSHNDFIQILLSMGLTGTILYIIIISQYIRKSIVNLSLINGLLFSGLIFCIAFFNGLFQYSDFVISLIYLSLIMNVNSPINSKNYSIGNMKSKGPIC